MGFDCSWGGGCFRILSKIQDDLGSWEEAKEVSGTSGGSE